MTDEYLQKVLQNIGLSESEAKVYLTLLLLGSATVIQIARSSDLKRTTVYGLIESLKNQGLVAIEVKGWKQKFIAENPEKLETIFNSKKEAFSKQLPKLSALYTAHESQSIIKYYEGLEAVKGVYEDLLKDIEPHDDYLVLSDQRMWQNLDPKYFRSFLERRAKLPVRIRMLLQDSEVARDMKKFQRNYNSFVKILSSSTKLSTNLIIIPRRVVIHQLHPNPLAIVIENSSVIQMHREMFEVMWSAIK